MTAAKINPSSAGTWSNLAIAYNFRTRYVESVEAAYKAVKIEDSKEMIVLFVDEMHLLMGAGSSGEGGMDAANLLKPMLARGELRCIGTPS